jgi:hypothetical protein
MVSKLKELLRRRKSDPVRVSLILADVIHSRSSSI